LRTLGDETIAKPIDRQRRVSLRSTRPARYALRDGLGIVTKRHQVVIVGAGPVGTALAVDL
jgi:hypothetical protein